ncbi:SGNH/GDSL hydrolase family protein [Konateibacter massiliensis]|uniref:SGNH/GDSL hydrolase family protein n=1 Tax=Konateibacter massiliensis TaxID=2002841 RepID=UPI000C1446E6|nr:GDSL-type esterase/lipase family protein [Konateibacter massiliensis]
MRTQFKTPTEYANFILNLAIHTKPEGKERPLHFKNVMRENRGFINSLSPYGPTKDGLERRNPLIVALGDSVTAGHFEFNGDMNAFFQRLEVKGILEDEIIEITDVKESYLEKFRDMLIETYEQTAVNAINAGIAGDTIYGMQKRLMRDVISHHPDLVLVNGSLNWGIECGSSKDYEKALKEVVEELKAKTMADIVLMTPNMNIPQTASNPYSTLSERVEIIRDLAKTEQVCLADVYQIWELYQNEGFPISELLANGVNHPSVTGHEVSAIVLMKLIKE